MFKRDRLTTVQVHNCLLYDTIPVRLVDVDIEAALQIASDFNNHAYDTYYLEIAKRFRFNVLSLDMKMISAA
jgi:predicted nucleic acid-binding protein